MESKMGFERCSLEIVPVTYMTRYVCVCVLCVSCVCVNTPSSAHTGAIQNSGTRENHLFMYSL